LFAHARAARAYLLACVVLGLVTAALVIAQATLLASAVAAAFHGAGPGIAAMVPLALVIVGRASLIWGQQVAAGRAGAVVKTQLRSALLRHVMRLGPAWLSGERAGELTNVTTRGLDGLDGYFARFLPHLVLGMLVPPAVLFWVARADPMSAVLVGVTLPLIPVFGSLVGHTARRRTDRQWRTLTLLAGHFLDLLQGMTTLKVFGRSSAQTANIRAATCAYARTTMGTLRVAFLSSLVLEVISSLSVALVAVSVGLRLVAGQLELSTALLVLMLAPEAYWPLRQIGAHYHASVEGLAVAERVFAVLETPVQPQGRAAVPDVAVRPLWLDRITIRYPDRTEPAVRDLSLTLAPGEAVALTGPSGSGKSTLVAVLLGFVRPDEGRVLIGATDLADLDPDLWRRQVAYVAQRPRLFAGTIADNVRLGRPAASGEEVRRALRSARAGFVDALPEGIGTRLGEGGTGMSAGQRQRITLARAFLLDAPLVILDEPTSGLDAETEALVLPALRRLIAGRTALLVAHRPALLAIADRAVELGPASAAGAGLRTQGLPA
jgi:thiol reductant ABC exporter CydD subunit